MKKRVTLHRVKLDTLLCRLEAFALPTYKEPPFERYTVEETAALKRFWTTGLTGPQIAKRLNRSLDSVYQQRFKLKLPSRPWRHGGYWAREAGARLRESGKTDAA